MKNVCISPMIIPATVVACFLSCAKEKYCEGCLMKNSPPVAQAGPNQLLTLPTDSAWLDGRGSTDPDGNISSYLWRLISDPSNAKMLSPDEVKTKVINLAKGTYRFELRVMDAGGLCSSDTMQLSVVETCDSIRRPAVQARLVPFHQLTKPKVGVAVASAGNKILFAGGRSHAICGPQWCEDWGSSRVDILDISTGAWSTAELSVPRFGIAAVTAGNKIFFAGGESGDGAFNEVYAVIDVYDASTNSWSQLSLSEPRSYVAAAAVGNKVIFAGGEINDNLTSSRVDIYDLLTNTWSKAALKIARAGISAISQDNKVYLAGGHVTNYWEYIPSSTIDIYDNATGLWSFAMLTTLTGNLAGVKHGNNIYWARNCQVEILNTNTQVTAYESLSSAEMWCINDGQNAVIRDNSIIWYRPLGDRRDKLDIYNTTNRTWSVGEMPQSIPYGASIISVNNIIYVAGGQRDPSGNYAPVNQVYTLEF